MIVILFYAILVSNIFLTQEYVLSSNKPSDDNDEERIVVEKLASIIRQQEQTKLKNADSDLENDETLAYESADDKGAQEADSSFSYEEQKPIIIDNVPRQNEAPMAVPPSDIRFFQNDFSITSDDARTNTKEDLSNVRPAVSGDYEKIASLPSATNQDSSAVSGKDGKAEEKKKVEDDDIAQRRRLYAHFMLNPSFIPHSGQQARSIRVPENYDYKNSTNLLALTYGTMCAIVAISVIVAFSIYKKLRKKVKDAEEVDYPAYGVTGPNKETIVSTGDRHLAHSAQMYHYQHQKQQMKAMEKSSDPALTRKGTESGSEDDDLAVYECPGLAPVTGEMEVNNPMFQEENDVKSSSSSNKEYKQKKIPPDTTKK